MKTLLLKFGLPIGMGLTLSIITVMAILSTTFTSCEKDCTNPECKGSDGSCLSCPDAGTSCSSTYFSGCSSAYKGVYCCPGGGSGGGGGTTGCTPTGCPTSAPWLGCGSCWSTSDDCHHRGTSNLSDDCSVCKKCP